MRLRLGVAVLLALQLTRVAAPAHAGETLLTKDSARALFFEALDDEDQHQLFEVALGKFRRVQGYQDSVNIRYRIATCLEGLGQHAAAFATFQAAVDLGARDPDAADVVAESRTHLAALEAKVARVTIVMSEHAAADAEIRVDDVRLSKEAMRDAIVLDAGHHTFTATSSDAPAFRTAMTLSEGSRLSLTIPLDPTTTAPKVAVALQAASRRGPQEKPPRPLPQAERPEGHGHSALGAVAIVAGGALLVGSGVVLLLRHAAISDLQSSCSGGCPPAREAELTSERSRALFEGPLAVGLSAAGVIAAGVGLYFVLQPGESSPAAPAPGAAKSRSRPTVANLRVLPVLSREGAMLGIGGSF